MRTSKRTGLDESATPPGDLEHLVGGGAVEKCDSHDLEDVSCRRFSEVFPGSPSRPNGLPIGRIGNPCSMDPPKRPATLFGRNWTSRFFFCWKNFCPLGRVCGLLLGGPMSGLVGSSTSILKIKSYGE